MTAPLAFVDTETTGLDTDRHEIWEVGLITWSDLYHEYLEHRWLLPVDLTKADPMALAVGRFHERHPAGNAYRSDDNGDGAGLARPSHFAEEFARLTHKAHLVGAVVSFDEQLLRSLLIEYGVQPSWHYHLVCVEALAAGFLQGRAAALVGLDWTDHPDDQAKLHAAVVAVPPWKSGDLSRAVGVDPEGYDKHTALGDARWAKAVYEAVMGR